MGYVNPTKSGEAVIQSTMVHEAHENQGIGSMLIRTFANRAFKSGVKKVFAEVDDGPDRFYGKCGFEKAHEWHSMRLSKR
jgi:predicted N-acetyltransferase YhbS